MQLTPTILNVVVAALLRVAQWQKRHLRWREDYGEAGRSRGLGSSEQTSNSQSATHTASRRFGDNRAAAFGDVFILVCFFFCRGNSKLGRLVGGGYDDLRHAGNAQRDTRPSESSAAVALLTRARIARIRKTPAPGNVTLSSR